MKLMVFNFNKILAEKKDEKTNLMGDFKIDSNIEFLEINKSDLDVFKGKEEIIELKFKYVLKYPQNIATLEFEGNIFVSLEPKEAKELIKSWKNKIISEDLRATFINIIIRRTAVRAMQLEEELNIPSHIPLPRVKIGTDKV